MPFFDFTVIYPFCRAMIPLAEETVISKVQNKLLQYYGKMKDEQQQSRQDKQTIQEKSCQAHFFHTVPPVQTYPMPRTVLIYVWVSSSILSLNRLIVTVSA